MCNCFFLHKRISGTPFPNEGQLSVRIDIMKIEKPDVRPNNPQFSSGPCAKPSTWTLDALSNAALGRSHRAKIGKDKLLKAIESTREILKIPENYKIGILPASDTGAVEAAMWSILGERPVDMCSWESFGAGWVTDAQLKITIPHTAPCSCIKRTIGHFTSNFLIVDDSFNKIRWSSISLLRNYIS